MAALAKIRPAFFKVQERIHYDAGFISDLHFIKKKTNAAYLYEFLCAHRFNTLYLNGDIFDGWKMIAKKERDFPEMQKRVMDRIAQMSIEEGTRLIYIPGNHDDRLRMMFGEKASAVQSDYLSLQGQGESYAFFDRENKFFVPVDFFPDHLFCTYSGKRFLVLHGDQFDPDILKSPRGIMLSKIADQAWHEWFQKRALPVEQEVRDIIEQKGKLFSLAKYMQGKFENLEMMKGAHVKRALELAKVLRLDGIISGHIHVAIHEENEQKIYFNSGDWTDGASAVVSDLNGELRLVDWMQERKTLGYSEEPPLPDEGYTQGQYRGVTENWIDWSRSIWPAKGTKAERSMLAPDRLSPTNELVL